MRATPLFIDTDIGTDIDDAYALVYALKHPNARVLGITTVSGDTTIRANICHKLLSVLRKEVPIGVGMADSAIMSQQKYVEDYGFIEYDEALKLMEQVISACKGAITIVALGPLTNIANFIRSYPELSHNLNIVLMGGALSRGYFGCPLKPFKLEYNIKCDIKSAQYVFESNCRLTMVGLDVTSTLKLPKTKRKEWKKSDLPILRELQALQSLKDKYLWYTPTIMYDPLAVEQAISNICEIEKMYLRVTKLGFTKPAKEKDTPRVNVCTSVDKHLFFKKFYETLENEY